MNGSYAISYGLDLAGFSKGKSALVEAVRKGNAIEANILKGHPFEKKLTGDDNWSVQLHEERVCIKKIVGLGDSGILDNRKIYIDVPIDLQNLLSANECEFVWELTRRPIDYALKALAPLANLIGVPVARMQSILADDGLRNLLGKQIFETYPKKSLEEVIETMESGRGFEYKSTSAIYDGFKWEGKIGAPGVSQLLNKIGATATKGIEINDDHFDAVVCAMTGLLDGENIWSDHNLHSFVNKMSKKTNPLPIGYKIIKSWPEKITIKIDIKQWVD